MVVKLSPLLLHFCYGLILVQINQSQIHNPTAFALVLFTSLKLIHMWSITQRSSQYHFKSLWYDLTLVGLEPQTSRTLGGHSTTTLQSCLVMIVNLSPINSKVIGFLKRPLPMHYAPFSDKVKQNVYIICNICN